MRPGCWLLPNYGCFFRFSLIIECATEKVSQFLMLLQSICSKLFCLNEQKSIFEHYKEV
jgi:hypothetical protein